MMMKKTVQFLNSLSRNNNRVWFEEHRDEYQEAKAEFEAFLFRLIPVVNALDPSVGMPEVKDCTYRIYRDIRFSGDKTPYKQHMGAYIAKGGKNSAYAGYYLHVEPASDSFCSGGIYCPEKSILRALREEIDDSWEEFDHLVHDADFISRYQWFASRSLKTVPKGFSKDSPAREWLRQSDYCYFAPLSEEQLLSPGLMDLVAERFKGMVPMNTFFNRVLRSIRTDSVSIL